MPITKSSFSEEPASVEFRKPEGGRLDDEDVVQAGCEVPDYPADRDPHNGALDSAQEVGE